MGIKQSAQVETPQINLSQWQYLPHQSQTAIQYGIFRTLRHKKSGELIDQYCIIWPNQQQYEYYLKSFNWRYKQPNIVNTKFISLNNTQSLCSRSFMAKIYIEHIKTRISQISDIPFPDNLYVLMESFEGYSNIFHHSKYFEIEQNQLCVDEYGNMKIWVNSDLSVNYPNNQGYNDYHRKGQQDMVQTIINIIAANTDMDTEPNPTFKEFYQQKKGMKGKTFEQAKVLVLNYARLNDTEIPDKFEAIVNMDKQDVQYNQYNQYTDNKSYQSRSRQIDNPNPNVNQQYIHPNQQQQPLAHTYSFSHNQPQFISNPQYYSTPYQQYPAQPQFLYHQPVYRQTLPQPLYYIPNPPPTRQIYYTNNSFHPQEIPSLTPNIQKDTNLQQILAPPLLNRNTKRSLQSEHEPNQKQMKETLIANLQQQLQDQYHLSNDQQQRQFEQQKDQQIIYSSNNKLGQSMSQADGLVSRSLPIKGGSVPQNNQHLSSMGQGIYSHIDTRDLNKNNKDGFGLTKNSQLKLKESIKESSTFNKAVNKVQKSKNPIKYFYSLNQQLQIDPDIAADMQRYLS